MYEAMPSLLVSCAGSLPCVRHNPLVPSRFEVSSLFLAWFLSLPFLSLPGALAVIFACSGEMLLVCMLRFVDWTCYSSVVGGVGRDERLQAAACDGCVEMEGGGRRKRGMSWGV